MYPSAEFFFGLSFQVSGKYELTLEIEMNENKGEKKSREHQT